MPGAAPLDIQLGGPIVRTSSDVPAQDPTPQTGFLENLRATQQEMELAGNTNAATENTRSAYAPIVDALEAAGVRRADGRHYLNPADLPDEEQATQYGGIPSAAATKAEMFAEIRRRRLIDKGLLPGVPDTPEAYDEQVRQRNAAKLQRIRGVQAGATGLGSVGGFLGGVAGSFEDPVNLWTMPFGGGAKTIVGAFARNALVNMAVEALTQPFAMRNYQELGENYGVGDALRSVLFAGGLGGAFGAAGHGLGALGRNRDQAAARIFGALPEPLQRRWANAATIDDGLLVDTVRAAVPEEHWTSEQKHAVNVLEREREIREASPFEPGPQGDEAHAQGLAAALQALIDGPKRPASRGALLSSAAPNALGAPTPVSRGASLSRDEIIHFTMNDLEGGARIVPYGQADGGTTKFGIAAKFNPGVDVGKLTDRQAADLYRERYWFAGLDHAPPATAAVAFDAGVISGPKVGQRILAASGGDPERAIALYRAHLNHIADTVAGKAKYRNGWNNRVDKLARKLELDGRGRAEPMTELAGLGETRGYEPDVLLNAELESARAAEAAAEAAAPKPREEGPVYEPVPILKRDLFPDDESWIAAQMRIGEAYRSADATPSPGNGPPARETDGRPAEVAPAPERAAGAPGAVSDDIEERLQAVAARADFSVDQLRANYASWRARDGEGEALRLLDAKERELGIAPAPLTRAELESMLPDGRGANGKRDPLWLLGLNDVDNRRVGREPKGGWVLRDKATGEVATWTLDKRAIERERAKQWEPEAFDVERLHPENVAIELRARAAQQAALADVDLDAPSLERFADPDGEGSAEQVESLEHDARMDGGDDGTVYRLTEDGPEQTTAELLAEIEADEAAADALRACLAPPAKAVA